MLWSRERRGWLFDCVSLLSASPSSLFSVLDLLWWTLMQWGRLSWSRILSHWISMIWPELKSAPVLGGFWRNLTAMQVNTVAVCQTLVRCLPRLHLFFFWVSWTCVASIIITQNCLWPQKIPFSKAARWVMRRPFGSNVFFFPSQIMCCCVFWGQRLLIVQWPRWKACVKVNSV